MLTIFFASLLVLQARSSTTLPHVEALVDYYNPIAYGGSMLDKSGGLGEPLNVIISAKSSPAVLTDEGLLDYARALGYDEECLGLHGGDPQPANLGDGRGYQNEVKVIRQSYPDGGGTCLETFIGGNHFRYWRQSSSGALFFAVSKEENLSQHHTIAPDGYNIGRDLLVKASEGIKRSPKNPENHYTTTIVEIPGLLPVGANGINHNISIDGIVKLFTVKLN